MIIFMKNYNEEYIKQAIDKYNQNAISKAQKIKKYMLCILQFFQELT